MTDLYFVKHGHLDKSEAWFCRVPDLTIDQVAAINKAFPNVARKIDWPAEREGSSDQVVRFRLDLYDHVVVGIADDSESLGQFKAQASRTAWFLDGVETGQFVETVGEVFGMDPSSTEKRKEAIRAGIEQLEQGRRGNKL